MQWLSNGSTCVCVCVCVCVCACVWGDQQQRPRRKKKNGTTQNKKNKEDSNSNNNKARACEARCARHWQRPTMLTYRHRGQVCVNTVAYKPTRYPHGAHTAPTQRTHTHATHTAPTQCPHNAHTHTPHPHTTPHAARTVHSAWHSSRCQTSCFACGSSRCLSENKPASAQHLQWARHGLPPNNTDEHRG